MHQDYGLVVDWETSGLPDQAVPMRTFLEGPQGIEIGAIVVRLPEFEPVAEFDTRVRFLGQINGIAHGGPIHDGLTWSADAERIHGITPSDMLVLKSRHPAVVAVELVRFIRTATGNNDLIKNPIMLCGHNPSFDAYFTRQLLFLGGCEREMRVHHRCIDSFTLGYFVFGAKTSDELFQRVSEVTRKKHSAIEDARLTLEALRNIYKLCRGLNTNGK